MNKHRIFEMKGLNLIGTAFLISSCIEYAMKIENVISLILLSDSTIKNTDLSMFTLIINSNIKTYYIMNIPLIIALILFVNNILIIIINVCRDKRVVTAEIMKDKISKD